MIQSCYQRFQTVKQDKAGESPNESCSSLWIKRIIFQIPKGCLNNISKMKYSVNYEYNCKALFYLADLILLYYNYFMFNRKSIFLVILSIILIFPLSAFSSRKKVKDNDDAALQRQQELMEKRAQAEAEIETRRLQAEREEEERIEAERLEVERLEKERLEQEELEKKRLEEERLEAERLEAERIENERLEQERQEAERQQQLEEQMKLALEKEEQKAKETKKSKEYLSDYMLQEAEEIEEASEIEYAVIKNPDEVDILGKTQLMKASKSGNEWQVKRLLEAGADTNLRDKDGWTALMYAVRYNEGLECVELLLNAGADIKLENNYGLTALSLAATYNNNPKILTKLLDNYSPSDKEVLRALVLLLSEQSISEDSLLSKLDILLETSLPLNILYEGKTPLMYAAAYGNSTKVIKKLLEYDASVTIRSTEGKTAFDYASQNKNLVHDAAYWALNVK